MNGSMGTSRECQKKNGDRVRGYCDFGSGHVEHLIILVFIACRGLMIGWGSKWNRGIFAGLNKSLVICGWV